MRDFGKLGCLLIIMSLLCQPAMAGTATTAPSDGMSLEQLEHAIYGQVFSHEPETQRLERLERVIFGDVKTAQAIAKRHKALADITSRLPAAGPAPSQNQPAEASEDTTDNRPDVTSYPRVTELERSVFNRGYDHEPLAKRLDRLETSIFGQTYADKSLVDRVDTLAMRIQEAGPANTMPATGSSFYNGGAPIQEAYRRRNQADTARQPATSVTMPPMTGFSAEFQSFLNHRLYGTPEVAPEAVQENAPESERKLSQLPASVQSQSSAAAGLFRVRPATPYSYTPVTPGTSPAELYRPTITPRRAYPAYAPPYGGYGYDPYGQGYVQHPLNTLMNGLIQLLLNRL